MWAVSEDIVVFFGAFFVDAVSVFFAVALLAFDAFAFVVFFAVVVVVVVVVEVAFVVALVVVLLGVVANIGGEKP